MSTSSITGVVADLRTSFDSGITKSLDWRRRQLSALQLMLEEHSDEWDDALHSDLRKSPTESQLMEVGFVLAEIATTLKNLRLWLRPKNVSVPAAVLPASAKVVREPLGVVLIISPWNYPVQLLLGPVVGAIAAGNAVVMKPSELAPAVSALFARLVPLYLDDRAVRVVEGAVPETTELLAERFDHIFYTGNGAVGQIVMEAAAKHLTPVTLELGGKSPTYVDDSVDLAVAARRIAWGKFVNAGQTCVAPDYVLATVEVQRKLAPLVADAIREMFGADPQLSDDYGRIVNERQFGRLEGLLGAGELVTGGDVDASERYIAPTVLREVPRDAAVMQQEIFGPILPFVTVTDVDDAIRYINSAAKPLALYVFTDSAEIKRRFITETSSGAIGFGVPLAHLSVPGLPFGGVGASGMGGYHGEHTINVFSHAKAVIDKRLSPDTMRLITPPYSARKDGFIRGFFRRLS